MFNTLRFLMSTNGRPATRKTERQARLEMGVIRFGETSVSCVLRNLSEAGAALDVGPQRDIADRFTLIIFPSQKLYSCNVVWRNGRRIGVSFEK
jgi:hypothetical protein